MYVVQEDPSYHYSCFTQILLWVDTFSSLHILTSFSEMLCVGFSYRLKQMNIGVVGAYSTAVDLMENTEGLSSLICGLLLNRH